MVRVSVLLGAGASVDAGLPTSEAMVDRLLVDFREQTKIEPYGRSQLRLLEFIVYSLRQEAAARGDVVGVDVETMFDAIETLSTRDRLSITPFISSWHPLVAEAERTTFSGIDSHAHRLSQLLTDAIKKTAESSWPSSFETERFVQELLESGKVPGSAFARLAEVVLHSLVRVLELKKPEKVRYLEPLAQIYQEQGQLDVATLNYDLTIETLGELLGIKVDDGMTVWDRKGRLEFVPGIHLLKLHGSIGWQSTSSKTLSPLEPFLPVESIQRVAGHSRSKPAVIFGAGNKLRASGPYLDLFRLLTESLEQCVSLLVVGYSFRDEHVNALLTNWFNADRARRLVILDPSTDRLGPNLHDAQAGLATHLAFLANQFPTRVLRFQSTAADGLVKAIEAATTEVA